MEFFSSTSKYRYWDTMHIQTAVCEFWVMKLSKEWYSIDVTTLEYTGNDGYPSFQHCTRDTISDEKCQHSGIMLGGNGPSQWYKNIPEMWAHAGLSIKYTSWFSTHAGFVFSHPNVPSIWLSVYQLTYVQLPEAKHCQGAQQLLRWLHHVPAEVHGYHGDHKDTPVWISYSTDVWRLPETVSSIIHAWGDNCHSNAWYPSIHPHVGATGW